MSVMVCNSSRAVCKYIRYQDSCDSSDYSDIKTVVTAVTIVTVVTVDSNKDVCKTLVSAIFII